MTLLTSIALVFLGTFCVDMLWAFYTRRVAAGAVFAAGSYSAVLYAAAGFVTTMYVANPYLLIVAAFGAFSGTALGVALDKRRARRAAEESCCDASSCAACNSAARG